MSNESPRHRDAFHPVVRTDHPLAGQEHITMAEPAQDPLLVSRGGCEPQTRAAAGPLSRSLRENPSTGGGAKRIMGAMSVLKEVRFSPEPRPVELPLNIWLDDADSAVDVIDALALSPFATGAQPWSCTADLERVRPEASLTPASGTLLRAASEKDGRDSRLLGGEGWTLRVIRHRNRTATVSVTAVDEELARSVIDEITKDAEEPAPESDHVEMGFWWQGPHGSRRSERPITASPWAKISGNYARSVGEPLSRLMTITPSDAHGRLVLLHGPPGTGKTTAAAHARPRVAVVVPGRLRARPGVAVPAPRLPHGGRGRL